MNCTGGRGTVQRGNRSRRGGGLYREGNGSRREG